MVKTKPKKQLLIPQLGTLYYCKLARSWDNINASLDENEPATLGSSLFRGTESQTIHLNGDDPYFLSDLKIVSPLETMRYYAGTTLYKLTFLHNEVQFYVYSSKEQFGIMFEEADSPRS